MRYLFSFCKNTGRHQNKRMAICRFPSSYNSHNTIVPDNRMDRTKANEKVCNLWLLKDFWIWIRIKLMFYNFFFYFQILSRKPFQLRYALIPYNLSLALLNLYIAVELLVPSISLKYNYVCEPCRQDYSNEELRVRKSVFFFLLLSSCNTNCTLWNIA